MGHPPLTRAGAVEALCTPHNKSDSIILIWMGLRMIGPFQKVVAALGFLLLCHNLPLV